MGTKKIVLVDDTDGNTHVHEACSFFIGDHGNLCITQTLHDWGAKSELVAVYKVWSNVMYKQDNYKVV
jgi:hypothetical protein